MTKNKLLGKRNLTRVLVSMPDDFLKQTDEKAKEEGRTRSELVRQALREYISEGLANV